MRSEAEYCLTVEYELGSFARMLKREDIKLCFMLLCLCRIPHASQMGPSQAECPGSQNPSVLVHFSLADFPQEHQYKSLLQLASLSLPDWSQGTNRAL